MHQTEDTLIHYQYLEGCIKSGNNAEVIRIIKERPFYDAEKVRNLIATSFLSDPMPMITLCHKHNFIEFLGEYLVRNNQIAALYGYASDPDSHKNLPRLLSALLDLNDPYIADPLIQQLLAQAGPCDNVEMIKIFESRKQLAKLYEWLKKIVVGDQTKPVHTAYAKVLVELDLSPKLFLQHNQNYERERVGRFCEN